MNKMMIATMIQVVVYGLVNGTRDKICQKVTIFCISPGW
jgi:hypothetical protein